MEQQKEYYAFISYKREDEKWAKWLQDKLEHYKFPTNLNGRTDLPRNIRPTFRDVTDLKPGLLAEEINNALRNSEWLIVVCSPRSAKSPWVCKEAQTFIDLGREDHIIPFVIEGNPFSGDNATECYPEALLNLTGSKELLAANINEMGRDAAAIKVVARMFNLRFDTLWQRYERELKRKWWIWIGGALLFAFASLCIGGYIAYQNRELDAKNKEVAAERDRANLERNRAETANVSLRIANENINKQRNDLDSINKELKYTNIQLVEEKNRVVNANREIQEQYRKIVAFTTKEANNLMDDYDYLSARKILINLKPDNPNKKIPYFPEIEYALRRSFESNSGVISGHVNGVHSVLFSPDGNAFVSCANQENIKIWDTYSGSLTDSIWNIDSAPSLSFFSNGNLVVSKNDSVTIWELSPLKRIHSYRSNISRILDIDSANRIVSVNSNKNNMSAINVIDGLTGKLLSTIPTNSVGHITSAIFLPNNQIATASMCDSIKIWDITKQKCVREWKAHEYGVKFLHSNKEGTKLISGEYGKLSFSDPITTSDSLRIWDVKSGKLLKAFPFSVQNAQFCPDGNRIVAIKGADLLILNPNNGKLIKTINGHKSKVSNFVIDKQGYKVVSFSSDGVIRVWDVNAMKDSIEKGNIYTVPMAFHPNGNMVLISSVDSIMAFNTNPVKLVRKFGKANTPMISSIVFNKEGSRFITTDGIATIWDTSNFSPICTIRAFKPSYAEISPNGTQVLTVRNRSNAICLWDISSGKTIVDQMEMAIKLNENDKINMASFSPDGKNIVSAHVDGKIRIWRADKNICVDSLVGHEKSVNTAFYSSDGKYIVSASADKKIKIWNVKSKRCMKTLVGHTEEVCYASFSNNGKNIISTSFDNTMRIWETAVGVTVKEVHSQGSTAALSQSGRKLIVVDSRGSFHMYDIPTYKELIEKARKQFKM